MGAASLCLTLLLACAAINLRAVRRVRGRDWSMRRWKMYRLYVAELVVQTINAIFYLVPNAQHLTSRCTSIAWTVENMSALIRLNVVCFM